MSEGAFINHTGLLNPLECFFTNSNVTLWAKTVKCSYLWHGWTWRKCRKEPFSCGNCWGQVKNSGFKHLFFWLPQWTQYGQIHCCPYECAFTHYKSRTSFNCGLKLFSKIPLRHYSGLYGGGNNFKCIIYKSEHEPTGAIDLWNF